MTVDGPLTRVAEDREAGTTGRNVAEDRPIEKLMTQSENTVILGEPWRPKDLVVLRSAGVSW